MEEKFKTMETKHQQELNKQNAEAKSLRERLETVKNMNLNLQKINAKHKKKADNVEYVTKKCEEIHKANQRLIQILGNIDAVNAGALLNQSGHAGGLDQDSTLQARESAFQMPLEEVKLYQAVIERYNMDDNINS